MYVAMTRAKRHLNITFSRQYEGNKKWKPSPFVDEIKNDDNTILTYHNGIAFEL